MVVRECAPGNCFGNRAIAEPSILTGLPPTEAERAASSALGRVGPGLATSAATEAARPIARIVTNGMVEFFCASLATGYPRALAPEPQAGHQDRALLRFARHRAQADVFIVLPVISHGNRTCGAIICSVLNQLYNFREVN